MFNASAVRGVGFDLDQTLHPREGTFARFLEAACARAGAGAVDRAELARLDDRGYGDKRVLLNYLAPRLGWSEQTHEARYERFVNENLAVMQPEPRLLAMLTRLARRYRLGVITNGRSRYQRAKLERLGLTPFFDPILVSEEFGAKKPARALFDQLAQAWKLPPNAIVFVGDEPSRDVEGARSAGMQAVWLGTESWPLATPAPTSLGDVLALEALLPP